MKIITVEHEVSPEHGKCTFGGDYYGKDVCKYHALRTQTHGRKAPPEYRKPKCLLFDCWLGRTRNARLAEKPARRASMTNGDFIRSMTDEDIAENLTPGICNLIQHRDPERCQTREHCFHCVKDWLKEENKIMVRADQWKN